jgi:Ni,Fe-hydrogenase III large subunit/Ni,Fe-hydrogenase III component G
MMLDALIAKGHPVHDHRPWPRVVVVADTWRDAVEGLASGTLSLLGLWGDEETVHMALLDEDAIPNAVAVLSLPCRDGVFPSVGVSHPPAIRLERTIFDLFGFVPADAADGRPWLDHGRWGESHQRDKRSAPYQFLPVEGEDLHQIPVGPVHAGIIEPGHFRFTASGETVVRLEQRLGYVHKGIESLMTDASLERAASLACHTSGDSAVAYGIAFARAAEAALGASPPARAMYLRALMAELERIANHLGDFGAVCNDASFVAIHVQCGVLRERVLRAAALTFGHRLMMDCIVPGGVAADIRAGGPEAVRATTAEIGRVLPSLIELYEVTASLQNRTVTTGILKPALARRFAAGGYVGRASGRAFDARRNLAYAPYHMLSFKVPVLEAGDVDARVRIRLSEIEQSLALIDRILRGLPDGPWRTDLDLGGGEGMAVAEGFRGDVLAWVRLNRDGTVARCHLRDPSWLQWPLLEAAIEGNIVADFPLCNKSFNCSYSGHDL